MNEVQTAGRELQGGSLDTHPWICRAQESLRGRQLWISCLGASRLPQQEQNKEGLEMLLKLVSILEHSWRFL